MNKLIYNFKEHGLYYENNSDIIWSRKVLFVISTVEINCSVSEGEVLSINGYLPLVKAVKGRVDIPSYSDEQYRMKFPIDPAEYMEGIGYDYFDYFPESEKYFVPDVWVEDRLFKRMLTKVKYDEERQIILLGTMVGNEKAIRINSNYIFGFDEEDNLKYICIQVDRIIR